MSKEENSNAENFVKCVVDRKNDKARRELERILKRKVAKRIADTLAEY